MANLTNDQHREAGDAIFAYMKEQLDRDGHKASIKLHFAHMQSLLMFAPKDDDDLIATDHQ